MKITYRPAMTAVLVLSMSLASAGSTVCNLALPANPTELKNMNFAQLFREANTLMEEGLWHQAARTWEEALKKVPGNRNARFRRAICLFEMGENLWNVQGELERSLEGNVATFQYVRIDMN
jgi:tetratricopeptide (TPR) repeat protein